MGKADIEGKEYFSDAARFADVFNCYLYEGRQVIRPENLSPVDAAEFAVPYGNNARVPTQKLRDVLRLWEAMTDGRAVYVVLGLELQTKVHYAMPVRCMLYDALNYVAQVREASRSYRRESNGEDASPMSPEEFLSGFRRGDRLMPVVTLVLYLGAGDWDGPTGIREMLDGCDDEQLMRYVPDYRMNLLVPVRMSDEELARLATEVQQLLKYLKYSGNADDLDRMMHADPRYSNLDIETAMLINQLTNSQLKLDEREKRVDMCKAIEDMRRESEARGMALGEANALVTSLRNLMANLSLTTEAAMDALGIPDEQRARIASLL